MVRSAGPLSLAALAGALLLGALPLHAQQKVLLPQKDRVLGASPAPVFSVGVEDGEEWEMFANVTQVAFDADDNLYVLDTGAHRVLVFDRAGGFVRQIGKKGGGPGELQAPTALAVTADGTVAVSDLGHRAYVLYGRDGSYRRSVPFPEGVLPGLGPLRAHPRGGVVSVQRPFGLRGPGEGRTPPRETLVVWHPLAEGAGPAPLFRTEPEERVRESSSGSGQRVERQMVVSGPPTFAPELNWAVLPGGALAVSNTPGYTVKVLGPDGKVARFIQKPMKVRKVTERDKERARDQLRRRMSSGEGMVTMTATVGPGGGRSVSTGVGGGRTVPKEMIEERVRTMEFAEVIPAIQEVRTDHAGRLWIERTGEEWGEPGPIDVVTAEGRYLGTLTGQRLPDAISPGGRAAYVERDDLGVERVVVRQLPAALR